MADRIKLRRGPKNKMDLNVYELGYATDTNEERLYFNNGSMVPIPNEKDITDIKTELTEATNVSTQNKKDVLELKESMSGIIKTGVAKLVMYSYDIKLSKDTQKVNIPYDRFDSATDTLKVYVNGIAIPNEYYTITNPIENEGTITNGYIVLNEIKPSETIIRFEIWKNVPSGEEGGVSGSIIAENSIPMNRVTGLNELNNKVNENSNKIEDLSNIETEADKISLTHIDGMNSTNVQEAVNELFTFASNGKNAIVDAITGIGVDANNSMDFSTLANLISNNTSNVKTGTSRIYVYSYNSSTLTNINPNVDGFAFDLDLDFIPSYVFFFGSCNPINNTTGNHAYTNGKTIIGVYAKNKDIKTIVNNGSNTTETNYNYAFASTSIGYYNIPNIDKIGKNTIVSYVSITKDYCSLKTTENNVMTWIAIK